MRRNHRSFAWAAGVGAAALMLAGTAFADPIVQTDRLVLPELGYIINRGTVTYPALGATLERLMLDNPSARVDPPEGGGTIDSFFDVFVEVKLPPLSGSPFTDPDASAGVHYHHLSTVGSVATYETEMLSLNVMGSGMMLRESPTLPSVGQTTITDEGGGGGGGYKIDSFFDVFTEISIDGGQNWVSASGPVHVTTELPEPATFGLLGLGALAFLRRRR